VTAGLTSERRACELVGIRRSVVQYRPRTRTDTALRERLKALAGRELRA
jgi:putative transposase